MSALAYIPDTSADREPPARRWGAIALTVAIHLLLLLMLLRLAPDILPMSKSGSMATFDVSPDRKADNDQPANEQRKDRPAARKAAEAARQQPQPKRQEQASETPGQITLPDGFIKLDRQQYRSTDIAGIKGAPSDTASANAGSDSGSADGGGASGGGIPGPEQLFDADWARRPTDAELAFYMPKNRRVTGAGLIACKTVPGNRVEDCRILGETPPGSGLGRAVLNASWQFRVKPPRVGDRPTIGAWVRIRIDYTEKVIN